MVLCLHILAVEMSYTPWCSVSTHSRFLLLWRSVESHLRLVLSPPRGESACFGSTTVVLPAVGARHDHRLLDHDVELAIVAGCPSMLYQNCAALRYG